MSANTKIAWCHHTFNPWWGCTKFGPGCANCYAERYAKRRLPELKLWGPGSVRKINGASYWREPLRWDRAAAHAGERRRILLMSMGDLFEDYIGPIVNPKGTPTHYTVSQLRAHVFNLIKKTTNLDWLLLTKRIENVTGMVPWTDDWPSNVQLGCSVSTQAELVAASDPLFELRGRVAMLFLSCEPLLAPVDIGPTMIRGAYAELLVRNAVPTLEPALPNLDWVIFGCESGPNRRPCELGWIRYGAQQCREAGIPPFVKQLSIDGRVTTDPADWPDDLRIQQFPAATARAEVPA